MPKNVTILGSTGSIGISALSVIDALPQKLRVRGLSAWTQWETLVEQIEQTRPALVAIGDEDTAQRLRDQLARRKVDTDIRVGADGLVALVDDPGCEFVLAAVVGAAGLPPVHRAIERGLPVGIANKEPLVVAGSLLVPRAKVTGSALIPVDSEHSAVYQCLASGRAEEVERIILTASGGPFRTWTSDKIEQATLEDALRHPTWSMGPKITIDSATMMNKALEIIEARWLFDINPDRIDVLIHPESIVHSLVEFRDGSTIAQLGAPDMRVPIQYALTWPDRETGCAPRVDLATLKQLNFDAPDPDRFPALRLGHEVARRGGTCGAALNAANEAAVAAFLKRELRFTEIVAIVEDVLSRHAFVAKPTMKQLLDTDAWARREVAECCRV